MKLYLENTVLDTLFDPSRNTVLNGVSMALLQNLAAQPPFVGASNFVRMGETLAAPCIRQKGAASSAPTYHGSFINHDEHGCKITTSLTFMEDA